MLCRRGRWRLPFWPDSPPCSACSTGLYLRYGLASHPAIVSPSWLVLRRNHPRSNCKELDFDELRGEGTGCGRRELRWLGSAAPARVPGLVSCPESLPQSENLQHRAASKQARLEP